jgi:hypothetical protein
MADAFSAVLEYGTPEPGEMASVMADKLRFHTDSWDLSVELKADHPAVVVIDARSRDAYRAGRRLLLGLFVWFMRLLQINSP